MSPRCFRAGTFFGLSRSVTFAATQRLDHVERRREPRLHLRQRSHLRIAQGVDFAQRLLTLSGERARCALEVHGHRRRIPRVVTLPAVGLALHVISIVLPGRVRHWEENAARVDDAGTVEPHDRDDLIGSRISLRILQDHSAGHQGRRVGGTGPDDLVAPDRDARRRLLALRDPGHVEILATPVGRVRYVDRDVGQLLVFAQPRAVLGEDGVRVDELVAPVHLRRVADEVADQPIRADLSFGEDLLRAFGLRARQPCRSSIFCPSPTSVSSICRPIPRFESGIFRESPRSRTARCSPPARTPGYPHKSPHSLRPLLMFAKFQC